MPYLVLVLALPAGAQSIFDFIGPDGDGPTAALIQASDGNLYGTTYSGGTNNYGTVFQITSTGTLTTLHMFTGSNT